MSKPDFAGTFVGLSFYGSTPQSVFEKLAQWDGWNEMEEDDFKETLQLTLYQAKDDDYVVYLTLTNLVDEIPIDAHLFNL